MEGIGKPLRLTEVEAETDPQVEKSDVRPYKILKDLTRTRFFIWSYNRIQ
jgi:hypothetical protein